MFVDGEIDSARSQRGFGRLAPTRVLGAKSRLRPHFFESPAFFAAARQRNNGMTHGRCQLNGGRPHTAGGARDEHDGRARQRPPHRKGLISC